MTYYTLKSNGLNKNKIKWPKTSSGLYHVKRTRWKIFVHASTTYESYVIKMRARELKKNYLDTKSTR